MEGTRTERKKSAERVASVDVVRVLAIVGVISIHTAPFRGPEFDNSAWHILGATIEHFARFAVPFFFVISGFFFGLKLKKRAAMHAGNQMALRIVTIFIGWSIIYLLPLDFSGLLADGIERPFKLEYWHLVSVFEHPFRDLFQGTMVHLWFLVSLISAVYISSLFMSLQLEKTLIAISIALYVFGVLGGAYANTSIGFHVNFDTRNGPFFSTFPFVLGIVISKFVPQKKWFFIGLVLFFLGFCMHSGECLFLEATLSASEYNDYVFSTVLMGIAATIIALSNHSFLRSKWISGVGRITLGIYAIHVVFVELFKPLGYAVNLCVWQAMYVVLVFIFSYATTYALSRVPYVRHIVS